MERHDREERGVDLDGGDAAALGPAPPDPEVAAEPRRRQFTAEYRLRILEETDRCSNPGETGRILRREGLYSSHLTAWRKLMSCTGSTAAGDFGEPRL